MSVWISDDDGDGNQRCVFVPSLCNEKQCEPLDGGCQRWRLEIVDDLNFLFEFFFRVGCVS